jgi:hypothetical protein
MKQSSKLGAHISGRISLTVILVACIPLGLFISLAGLSSDEGFVTLLGPLGGFLWIGATQVLIVKTLFFKSVKRDSSPSTNPNEGLWGIIGLVILLCLFAFENVVITKARIPVETHSDSLLMPIFSTILGLLLGSFVFWPLFGIFKLGEWLAKRLSPLAGKRAKVACRIIIAFLWLLALFCAQALFVKCPLKDVVRHDWEVPAIEYWRFVGSGDSWHRGRKTTIDEHEGGSDYENILIYDSLELAVLLMPIGVGLSAFANARKRRVNN